MKQPRMSGIRSPIALLLCGLGLLLMRPAWADLDEFNRLVQTGTPELALYLVEREQPDPATDLSEWLVWERQRIALMRSMGRWDGLLDRLEQFPDGLPSYVSLWVAGQRAEAFINKGAPETARNLIRRQLWSEEEKPVPVQAHWRRLIIQAY